MHAWVFVAELVKTKSLKGGLVARSAPGLPFLLHEGMEAFFVPPRTGAPRHGVVSVVKPLGPEANYIEFDSVDTINAAEALVGCSCLVRRVDLPRDYALKPVATIVGFAVEDETHGLLGTVAEVIENRAQSLIAVDGLHGEILIPYVEVFVRSVDPHSQLVKTAIPDGLLDN